MSETSEKKSSRTGRKKIKIERIEDSKNRQVTFNKRKYSSDPIDEVIEDFYDYEGSFEVLDNSDLHNLRPGKASSIRVGRKERSSNPYSSEHITESIPVHPQPHYQYTNSVPASVPHLQAFKRTRLNNGYALYKGGNSFGTPGSHPVTPDTGNQHLVGIPQQEVPYHSQGGFDRWGGDKAVPFVSTPAGNFSGLCEYSNFPHHPKALHVSGGAGHPGTSQQQQQQQQQQQPRSPSTHGGFPHLQLESHPSLTQMIHGDRQDSFGPHNSFQHSSEMSMGFLMHDIAAGRTSQNYDFQHDGIFLAPNAHMHHDNDDHSTTSCSSSARMEKDEGTLKTDGSAFIVVEQQQQEKHMDIESPQSLPENPIKSTNTSAPVPTRSTPTVA